MMKTVITVFTVIILLQSCAYSTDALKVEVIAPVLPVLTKKSVNPVLKIEIIRQQQVDYLLEKMAISLKGYQRT